MRHLALGQWTNRSWAAAFKVRYVRTPAGERRYKVPIGSPIPIGRRVKRRPDGAPNAGRPRIDLTAAQADVADRHFGGPETDGAERGARRMPDGSLEVVDSRQATATLDRILESADLPADRRAATEQLRASVAATPPPVPQLPAGPEPGGVPRMSSEDLEQDWRDRITTTLAERRAVANYTGTGYNDINAYLREGRPDGFAPATVATTDALAGLAGRYELPASVTAYRSVFTEDVPAYPATPGSTFADLGFSSVSTTDEVSPYASYANRPVRMEIDIPQGSNVVNVNGTGLGINPEKEMILPPGTRYQVRSDEMRDGVRWLRMTALPPT